MLQLPAADQRNITTLRSQRVTESSALMLLQAVSNSPGAAPAVGNLGAILSGLRYAPRTHGFTPRRTPRRLRSDRTGRRRRHGRGLSRARYGPRTRRGAEGAA